MKYIHYIWMGNPLEHVDNFSKGPNHLAEQLEESNKKGPKIIMWVPQKFVEDIKKNKLLKDNIKLNDVESLYKKNGLFDFNTTKKTNLKDTVELLEGYKAYSAQKDLLSFAILEKHGGLYLDTTTMVEASKLMSDRKNIWFPRIVDKNGDEIDHDETVVYIPEVWALYNPTPGDKTFEKMSDSYIQRCKYYFPEDLKGVKFIENTEFEEDSDRGVRKYTRTGYDFNEGEGMGDKIMKNVKKEEVEYFNQEENKMVKYQLPSVREKFIGKTVIHSFLDGLKAKIKLNTTNMGELCTLAEDVEGGKSAKDFGITKSYKGTWRNVNPENKANNTKKNVINLEEPIESDKMSNSTRQYKDKLKIIESIEIENQKDKDLTQQACCTSNCQIF